MELNLFFLAPLLQCTSIYRCALFMRAKKKNVILFYPATTCSFFFHSFYQIVPLSLSFTLISPVSQSSSLRSLKPHHSGLSSHLWSSLSQLRSLIVNLTATEARRHRPTSRPMPLISLKPTPPSTSDPRRQSKCLLVDIGYLTGKPMELANPARRRCACLWSVIFYFVCDRWFCFGLG